MSLAIDVDKVAAVLVAGQWHGVDFDEEGKSTFVIDAYEFVEAGVTLVGVGGAGAEWVCEGRTLACPVASIQAVRLA